MDGANHSMVSDFVFLGLSNSWEIQLVLFVFSCMFYVASMMGNSLIVLTVTFTPQLHAPMYFLLANLSFIDMAVSSVITPKMIYDIFRKHKVISFGGCIAQIFFLHAIGGTEMVLLIAMAFDRYVAICKPLHYLTIMSQKMCILLLVGAWIIGVMHSVIQLVFVIKLPFCGPNVMDSFYCDLPRFIKLACIDTYRLEFMVTALSGFISVGSFFVLMISYIFILVTVWKHSSSGLSKALSTLSSHIMVVILFFGPCIFVYTWPYPTSQLDKILAIFDVLLTPFLNPVIYTFRNKEMKLAIRRICSQLVFLRKVIDGGTRRRCREPAGRRVTVSRRAPAEPPRRTRLLEELNPGQARPRSRPAPPLRHRHRRRGSPPLPTPPPRPSPGVEWESAGQRGLRRDPAGDTAAGAREGPSRHCLN
ncbi:olfactory receptor 4F3/4F16/4F29-like [Rhynchocyon petersi]